MTRPAEIGGMAGALAFLICRLVGVTDAATVTALGTVVGFVPAAITWVIVTFRSPPSATPPPAVKP